MSTANPIPEHRCEDRILLLAIGPGENSATDKQLRHLLDSTVDWTGLFRSAVRHRVVPLLGARLEQIGPPLVPLDIIEALGVRSRRNQERGREIESALLEIAAEAGRDTMDMVLLDGPPVTRMIYSKTGLHEPIDPLLLVATQNLDALQKLLTRLDYVLQASNTITDSPEGRIPGATTWVYSRNRDEGHSAVEICTEKIPGFRAEGFESGLLAEGLSRHCDPLAPLRMPSVEHLIVIRSVLGGLREWADLIGLCDIAWLLQRHPETDLRRVRSLAQTLGAERFLFLALRLVQHFFGLALDLSFTNSDFAPEDVIPRLASRLLLEPRDSDQKPVSASAINYAHWSKRSDAWEKWSDLTLARSAEISRVLIDTAAIKPGDRVLDIACGVGDTSLELSLLVGAAGLVVASDLSLDMAYRTRRRGKAQSLDNLLVCTAAMEKLPFNDQSFDGIICRLGIMYCPQVQGALGEALRVLRRGGRAAYLVCGPRDDNPILKIVNEVTTDLFGLESGDGTIDPFRFAPEGSLAEQMEHAGFVDVEEGDLVSSQYPAVGTSFWQASFERGLSLAVDQLPVGTRKELKQRMARAFAPYIKGDFYELTSLSRITRGTRS